MANWYPTDYTIGTGVRSTPITITTTPTSLDELLNTAVAGRSSLVGRRSLTIRNLDSTNPFYILESAGQTVTNGWNVEAGDSFTAQASESATANQYEIANVPVNGGAGFYLACSAGTIAAKVLEVK